MNAYLPLSTVSHEHHRLYLDLVLLYKILHALAVCDIGLCPVRVSKLRNRGHSINSTSIPASILSVYCFSFHTCKLLNVLPISLPLKNLNIDYLY